MTVSQKQVKTPGKMAGSLLDRKNSDNPDWGEQLGLVGENSWARLGRLGRMAGLGWAGGPEENSWAEQARKSRSLKNSSMAPAGHDEKPAN